MSQQAVVWAGVFGFAMGTVLGIVFRGLFLTVMYGLIFMGFILHEVIFEPPYSGTGMLFVVMYLASIPGSIFATILHNQLLQKTWDKLDSFFNSRRISFSEFVTQYVLRS